MRLIWWRFFLALLLWIAALRCAAQFPGQKTYCNPIDINYQYNFEQKARGISYRSGADPVIVNHKGEYYLFVTISGGWWHSKDLVNWSYIKPKVAPAGCWRKGSGKRPRDRGLGGQGRHIAPSPTCFMIATR